MIHIDAPPYAITGTVYGVVMNDPASLQALGDSVHQAPYMAPPRYPVLYVKPRNTHAGSGTRISLPADAAELEIGATVGLVIGRPACRVAVEHAMDYVAGALLAVDLSVPHGSYYRPSVRFKALDGSCLLSSHVAPMRTPAEVAALSLDIRIDGAPAATLRMDGLLRPAAALLSEISDFMTLDAGDVLLLGLAHDSPRARAGQRFSVHAAPLGELTGELA